MTESVDFNIQNVEIPDTEKESAMTKKAGDHNYLVACVHETDDRSNPEDTLSKIDDHNYLEDTVHKRDDQSYMEAAFHKIDDHSYLEAVGHKTDINNDLETTVLNKNDHSYLEDTVQNLSDLSHLYSSPLRFPPMTDVLEKTEEMVKRVKEGISSVPKCVFCEDAEWGISECTPSNVNLNHNPQTRHSCKNIKGTFVLNRGDFTKFKGNLQEETDITSAEFAEQLNEEATNEDTGPDLATALRFMTETFPAQEEYEEDTLSDVDAQNYPRIIYQPTEKVTPLLSKSRTRKEKKSKSSKSGMKLSNFLSCFKKKSRNLSLE